MTIYLLLCSFLFAGLALNNPEPTSSDLPRQESSLVHTVYFWFHDEVSDEDAETFYGELKKLREIPQIQHGWIGVPAATEERGVIDNTYDYSITFVFADEEAEAAYQIHPIHTRFVEVNSHLWENVIVYDAMTPSE
ncbi:MAG: Dabb family protein [Balneolaceae bacterium]